MQINIDVYHCGWDPQLEQSIQAAAIDRRIFALHVSDWLPDTKDMLLDRGMMGDGVIDLNHILEMVESRGYDGMVEVEMVSRDNWWTIPPDEVLRVCAARFQGVCQGQSECLNRESLMLPDTD